MTSAAETAQTFMEALWAGDTEACSTLLTNDATWVFQHGMPQSTSRSTRIWPAREALQRIIDDLFGKFDPEGFSVTMTKRIGDGPDIAFEYQASGRTTTGQHYHGTYVTCLTVRDSKVADVRPYNDTLNMIRALMPE
jgi:ketosteroid isomerase-like protein